MTSRVFVPADSASLSVGADAVASAIASEAQRRGIDLTIVRTGSRGLFWLEPLVEVEGPNRRIGYGPIAAEDAPALLDAQHDPRAGRLRRGGRRRPEPDRGQRHRGDPPRCRRLSRRPLLQGSSCALKGPFGPRSARVRMSFSSVQHTFSTRSAPEKGLFSTRVSSFFKGLRRSSEKTSSAGSRRSGGSPERGPGPMQAASWALRPWRSDYDRIGFFASFCRFLFQ